MKPNARSILIAVLLAPLAVLGATDQTGATSPALLPEVVTIPGPLKPSVLPVIDQSMILGRSGYYTLSNGTGDAVRPWYEPVETGAFRVRGSEREKLSRPIVNGCSVLYTGDKPIMNLRTFSRWGVPYWLNGTDSSGSPQFGPDNPPMKTTPEMNRRSFIRRSGTAATAFAAPYFIPSGVLARDGKPGANDRIGIAVIGPGRQGGGLLGSAGNSPQARIVAIADVNLPRAQQRAAKYKAAVYKDYRELLERKDVDLPSENPSQIRSP
jgi:hypothetical protein